MSEEMMLLTALCKALGFEVERLSEDRVLSVPKGEVADFQLKNPEYKPDVFSKLGPIEFATIRYDKDDRATFRLREPDTVGFRLTKTAPKDPENYCTHDGDGNPITPRKIW